MRVVSMPSTTTFDRQSAEYKAAVLPKGLPAWLSKWQHRWLVEIRLHRRGRHRHLW